MKSPDTARSFCPVVARHVEVLVNNSTILKDKVRFAATIVGVTAIITLLSVIAFSVSTSSPTFTEDEDFALCEFGNMNANLTS